jgi:glycosyltransferase involved in cell wall biosynthesis
MHITAVIPAHNTSKYIGECISSILKQEYTDYDILVVDDGSTDNTIKVVESFFKKGPVSLVTLGKNLGVTYATHQGILHAQGPIITIIDSDDMVYKNSFSTGIKPFKDKEVGFAWTQFDRSNGKRGWSHPTPQEKSLYRSMMYEGWWKASHQRFFRKSVYMNGIHMNCEIDRSSDFQLILLVALSGCKTVHVPVITYWYRVQRKGSITTQGSVKQRNAVVLIKKWLKQEIIKRGIHEPS